MPSPRPGRTTTLRSLARVASEALPHPIVAQAISAPRRVHCSSSLGRISYYEDAGVPGLPALLLHDVATPGSAFAFRALFDELRRDRPVVAPDLLGHGYSPRRKPAFTRAEHVRFVEEVLADVAKRFGMTVDVVAVGTTCEVAAEAIVRSSRRVRSLVMISPTGFVSGPWLATRLRALLARATRAGAGLRDPNVAAEVYDALRVPTCFVHGDAFDVPRLELDVLAAGHPSFRHSEIHGARTAPHVERPAETVDTLRAFWRTLAVKPELRLVRGQKSERGDQHGPEKRVVPTDL
jgi:pimeloyl-ACP methyl ester carboxylesterase